MPVHSERLFSGCDVRPECGRSAESSCLVSEALTARERDILAMISQGLSKKHIARAFEISPDSVKSHVKHILLKLVRIWGVDPHGPPSQENMWQRIHPDDRERVWAEVQEALRQKRDLSDRVLAEAFSTQIDVTERKRAQDERQKLRQLQSDLAHINRLSMVGELAASLFHEITQPIASARNNARAACNFLDNSPPDLGEVREALGCVVSDADRAGDIVDRIREQIKKAPPRKALCDLNAAINEVIVLARSAIMQNGVSVQSRLAKGLSLIHGDRVQLQQVVLNLILNAVEAMGSSKAATRDLLISSEQDNKDILVTVRDSGPGINPAHLERVFDAFYTTKPKGVGMGLSICRTIINAHGGLLWAEANEPRGTVFQFTLPLQTTHEFLAP